MKKMIIVVLIMLCGVTAKSQIAIDINNATQCDVEVKLHSSDVKCAPVTNFGSMMMLPSGTSGTWTLVDPSPVALEFTIYLRVGGGPWTGPIGASGLCHPTSLGVGQYSCGDVNAVVYPVGPAGSSTYQMDIYP